MPRILAALLVALLLAPAGDAAVIFSAGDVDSSESYSGFTFSPGVGNEIIVTGGVDLFSVSIGMSDSFSGTVSLTVEIYDADGTGGTDPFSALLLGSETITVDLPSTVTSSADFTTIVFSSTITTPSDGAIMVMVFGPSSFTFHEDDSAEIGTFVGQWLIGTFTPIGSETPLAMIVTSVPEPSSYLMMLGLAAFLGISRRRAAAA